MLIANPIYDSVFKRVLEDDESLRFLIGTLIGETVISAVPRIQEHTGETAEGKLTLFRKDFSVTLRTGSGEERKAIVELQKARKPMDIMRFRRYLGNEYQKDELPIISIYILGFNLPDIEIPSLRVTREFVNMQTSEVVLYKKNTFIEALTHDAIIVQALRIPDSKPKTALDNLLNFFVQRDFADDKKTIKKYDSPLSDVHLQKLALILEHIAADKDAKKELEDELYYLQYLEDTFGKTNRELEEKDRKLEAQASVIEEKDLALSAQASVIEENEKKLKAQAKELEELKRQLTERFLP